MPFLVLVALIIGAGVIPDLVKQDERRTAIQQGLEECPNPKSNYSNDTIWVKDCESLLRGYNKEKGKDLKI